MRYFELVADRDQSNPLKMEKVDQKVYKNNLSREEFSKINSLVVGYFNNSPQVEIFDVLWEPAFLVSDALKRLLALFDREMEFKAIQLFARDLEDAAAPLYWLPELAAVDCLSEQSKKYPNGMLEQMVLKMEVPFSSGIFRVAGILEHKIIVSMDVAESMIRRRMSGFTFVPVVFASKGAAYEEE